MDAGSSKETSCRSSCREGNRPQPLEVAALLKLAATNVLFPELIFMAEVRSRQRSVFMPGGIGDHHRFELDAFLRWQRLQIDRRRPIEDVSQFMQHCAHGHDVHILREVLVSDRNVVNDHAWSTSLPGFADDGTQVQVQIRRGVAIGEVLRPHDVSHFRLQQDVQWQASEVATSHCSAECSGPGYEIGPQIAHGGH